MNTEDKPLFQHLTDLKSQITTYKKHKTKYLEISQMFEVIKTAKEFIEECVALYTYSADNLKNSIIKLVTYYEITDYYIKNINIFSIRNIENTIDALEALKKEMDDMDDVGDIKDLLNKKYREVKEEKALMSFESAKACSAVCNTLRTIKDITTREIRDV